MNNFSEQIREDIEIIQSDNADQDMYINKAEYAFNYWVLGKLYNIDEELIHDSIVEYNDKGIDCYAHFEDSKELYIIQNKYYSDFSRVSRKDVSDFLESPLSQLLNNVYNKSKDLQTIFNEAKNDPEYKIWLHFYVTNNNKSNDADNLIRDFNIRTKDIAALLKAELFYLDNIYDLYYHKQFKEDIKFTYNVKTLYKGTALSLLPEEYNLKGMSKAYYVMTPIISIYKMYEEAMKKDYPIFEENIREYLGSNSVNKGIIDTLNNKKDRNNFFYYNNGITVICDEAKGATSNGFNVTLYQPQIVNGCQTVNSIKEVLKDYSEEQLNEEFGGTYVMVKVLVIKDKNPKFYKDIVKFTNRQNSINDNAFGANKDLFLNLQKSFKDRGFLLCAKPSDSNKFRTQLKSKALLDPLLIKANKYVENLNMDFNKLSDIMIPLDKLLQVYLALLQDGSAAYKKKNQVLKPTSKTYADFSTKIQDYLSVDNMIKLFLLYKKAETDKKNSDDKKTPIPYYLIGFLGHFINKSKENCYNNAIGILFNTEQKELQEIYDYFANLTSLYKEKSAQNQLEYNYMIKQPINNSFLEESISTLKAIKKSPIVQEFINGI